jgi:hypothetical protein
MNYIRKNAVLFVVLFVALAFVSTTPMLMVDETEGGGGGSWTSSTWTLTDSTTATFTGSAYTSGTGYMRYYASGYNDDCAGGYLLFRKSFTATDSSTHFDLDYKWQYYCNANGFVLSVFLYVKHGADEVWNHCLWSHVKYAGSGPTSISADNTYSNNVGTTAGYSYYYEVRVTIGSLNNAKSSAGYFCKSSSELTTSSYWDYDLTISY